MPVVIKVSADWDAEMDSAEQPRPLIPRGHLGFRDVKMVPFNYHDPPEVYPVRHIVQFAAAISQHQDPDRRLSVESFVSWNREGRISAKAMVRHFASTGESLL